MNVELNPKVFKNIRGTLSKTVHYDHGVKVTEALVAVVRNGKQHLYRRTYRRDKPATPAEQQARENMAFVNKRIAAMTPDEKAAYATMFSANNGTFNGKTYRSLHGYIVARFLAALKNDPNDQVLVK